MLFALATFLALLSLGALYNAVNSETLNLHSRGWLAVAICISAIVAVTIAGYQARVSWQLRDTILLGVFAVVLLVVSTSLVTHYKNS